MDNSMLLSLCAFGTVASVAWWIMSLFQGDSGKLRDRLKSDKGSSVEKGPIGIKALLTQLGQAAASPFMPKKRETISSARRNLAYAGIYSPSAVKALYGFKFIFLLLGLIGGYAGGAITGSLALCLPVGALVGIYAPVFWLKQRIKINRRQLDYGLADALDLMVVCVEAGLTLDSAMQRIAQELAFVHPSLSRELGIAHMETRVGLSRAEALRNLGSRTGTPGLQSMAAMLVQAERFGTSIASALRVHAEGLRLQRQYKAEEMASTASVKMSIPLVLFIFPATFIVLAGPTVIQLLRSPLFK
jgi:tight adherence protein C